MLCGDVAKALLLMNVNCTLTQMGVRIFWDTLGTLTPTICQHRRASDGHINTNWPWVSVVHDGV